MSHELSLRANARPTPPTLALGAVDVDTPIQIPTPGGVIEMSVRDVVRLVHPDAPTHEAFRFLMVCRMAGYNPFLGEAHLVNHGGRWSVIVDKAGYLGRAEQHPAFRGWEAGIIAQPYDPAAKAFTGPATQLDGTYLPQGMRLVGGWARVHRADRAIPAFVSVGLGEYYRDQATWKQIPCTMIRKVALVQALRESGLITSGWYDPAEIPAEPIGPGLPTVRQQVIPPADVPRAIEAEFVAHPDASCPPDLVAAILAALGKLGADQDDEMWRLALARRNVAHVSQLSAREATQILHTLEGLIDEPDDFTLPADYVRPGPAGAEAAPPSPQT